MPLRVQSATLRSLQGHRKVIQETGSEVSAGAKEEALWGHARGTPNPELAESEKLPKTQGSHADLR